MEKLKEYWKQYKKYIGWVLFVLITIGFIICQKVQISKLNEQTQLQNVELSTLKDSVLHVVTKNGVLLNKIESIEVDKKNLKDALEIAGFDKKELKDENIKLKDLNFALKARLEATGSISTTVHDTIKVNKTDTIYYTKVDDWSDNRLSLYGGTITDNRLDFTKYTFNVDFKQTISEQKNKTIVTVKFENNEDGAIKLTNANSIIMPNQTKWYEKWWLWGTFGLVSGILITK